MCYKLRRMRIWQRIRLGVTWKARKAYARLTAPRQPRVPSRYVLARNRYGEYCIPRSGLHRPAAHRVLTSRVWEQATIDLLQRQRGDVVHAGTSFGDFLPALDASRQDGETVWAFEPNSENHRCAQMTVLLNDLGRVQLRHAALTARPGKVLLAVTSVRGRARGGGSRVVSTPKGEQQVEEVAALTIDEAIPAERRVGVIQLDVEGHEQPALEGALATIARCRPLLVLESAPAAEWFKRTLAPLGYGAPARVHNNRVYRPAGP